MASYTRRNFGAFAASLAACGMGGKAFADAFPSRPIRLVVPYAPGGGADMVARALAQRLADASGWTVVVDNKAGANGMIGTDLVAKAPADGHTLLLADTAFATNPAVQPRMTHDAVKDFAPITLVGSSPQLLVAHPAFEAGSLQQMLALPRDRVRGAGVGTSGPGSVAHLLLESLKSRTGMDLVHVPYKGGGAALGDAVAGQIPLVVNSMPACMPHVDAKRLRILAVASPSRHPRLPQVQTFAESVPGILGSAWYGVLAPARTPPAVLQRIDAAFGQAIAAPEVQARFVGAYIDPLPPGPQAFSKFLSDEMARWQAVAKQAGVTAGG
ncbi:MAG: tripartite tricarboxylate transporter substrate binding protein [Xylophilus ampelinus]